MPDLMEEVENSLVEGKIRWLAQTILQGIFSCKDDEWIRHTGLGDGMKQLKSEIERIETVVAAVKGRSTGNKPLARTLARLRELMYDADDLVDELDYFRLQEQVKGRGTTIACANEAEGTDGHGAEQVNASRDNPNIGTSKRRKNRTTDGSPNGTSDADSLGGKRKRANEASTHRSASTTQPWDKVELSNRIQQIVFELQGSRGNVCDFLKDSVACSVQSQSNKSDRWTKTSSSVSREVHGRDVEKSYVIRVITSAESDVITVLPIVGIVGVGKTAVAQLVYNDPTVISQFERIWVCVSNIFDKVRLTREMIDVVALESHNRPPHNKESHKGMSNYSKLQDILKGHMGHRLKRFLLVLDDVTDHMDNYQWNELLSPLKSSDKKGNVIVVTTRNLSVARRLGTVEPIKLGALEDDAFWLLFKACAFGDESNAGHPADLNNIGHQIAAKLKGNPLTAVTTGELLKKHLTIHHWSTILKREEWKSMQLNTGIMHSLKLSFDKIPYHLQQCFLFCSTFPDGHKFLAEDLVCIWISQGFVRCIDSSKTLEDIGRDYLEDLVNLCFFEQVQREGREETEEPSQLNQTCYVMCGIMHEFARVVSRTEIATICSLECKGMLPTIRHVSVLTDSACCNKDEHGSILRNKMSEEKMQSIVPLVRNLRTLILMGSYESFFFRSFQDILRKARNLRFLQISVTQADFHTFICNSVNPTHLRYLKFESSGRAEASPIPLSKFYHLEVLSAGHPTIVHGMNDLISMRYLSVTMGAHSSVPSIGTTSTNQDMQNSTDQNSSQSEITQLRSMNKLVQLGVFHLVNVSRAEADGAKLRDKKQLEKLLLSWKRIDGCHEPLIDTETEWERSQMNGSNNSRRYGAFIDMAHDVLEGLEPNQYLKHLQISGYSGYTYPAWLATSVTSLQMLHLEDCGEWETLPSLERLQLTKLKLRNMQKVNEVSIPSSPSLEELVLIEMPKLKRCSCNSVTNLNFSLRVLSLQKCPVLEVFSLFENCEKLKIEHKSWLSCVEELTIYECPQLMVSNPLPPSSNVCKLNIAIVWTLPTMMGSSREQLMIGRKYRQFLPHDPNSDLLTELDDKILSFHNLRALKHLQIVGCRKLSSISLEGFRQLISLKTLEIDNCINLFSPNVLPEHAHEDMTDATFNAFPSLKHLRIKSCGITGRWLSVMLQHAFALEELNLDGCRQISELLVERKESSSSNHTSTPRAPSAGNTRDALISKLLRIPSNFIPSLKKLAITGCDELTYQKKDFSDFTSLEELMFRDCPVVTLSLEHADENNNQENESWLFPHSLGKLEIYGAQETLQPRFLDYNCLKSIAIKNSPKLKRLQLCFCTFLEDLRIYGCKSLVTLHGNFTCLRKLELCSNPGLKLIQLRRCTALEDLQVRYCESLYIIEGLQSLKGLRYLDVVTCPGLTSYLERQLSLGYELLTGLERLHTNDYSFLTMSFCKRLNSLQEFCISRGELMRFTNEQERALQQLRSLQDLRFVGCDNLTDLPVVLRSLPSLKRLEINDCWEITRLPADLPPSLEELKINGCSGLIDVGRMLATRRSKPKVKINGKYVN
ncbi:hypothetical protein HU200_028278 [Digitaria exilis]|uniref:Uncharacterized protein n=1 Tax=Digitaria exilis TaxID=1010633 RepID=A0A835BSS5_9POAL|nr:hypothetical protein HU200_028278 [Digitaria exilis]